MTLFQKIVALYPELMPTLEHNEFIDGSIVLQNDGYGDYIAKWEHPTLSKPTQAQLDAVK